MKRKTEYGDGGYSNPQIKNATVVGKPSNFLKTTCTIPTLHSPGWTGKYSPRPTAAAHVGFHLVAVEVRQSFQHERVGGSGGVLRSTTSFTTTVCTHDAEQVVMRDAEDVLGLFDGILEASLAHLGAVGAPKRLRFQHRGRVPEAFERATSREKKAHDEDLQPQTLRQFEYKHDAVVTRRTNVSRIKS